MVKFYIYSTPNCSFCTRAKKLAEQRGLQYKVIDLTQDESAKAWFKSQGFKTVPQIYAGAEYIGGYSELVSYVKTEEIHHT